MKDQKIAKGLSDIRRRRVHVWVVLLSYLPAMMLVTLFVKALRLDQDESIVVAAALAWMALFAVTISRAGWVRCPRCGGWFNLRGIGWFVGAINPFTQQCMNCKLPLR